MSLSLLLFYIIHTFITYNPDKLSFMKRVITVLIVSVLLLSPSCTFVKEHNPFTKKAREAEAIRQQQEAFRVADSIEVAEKEAARLRQLEAEQTMIAQQETQSLSNYHIIVGSFLTPDYATSWADHITQMGYNTRIIEMGGGRWRLVSVNSYPSLKEAWNALSEYQEKIILEAWIFKP